MAYRVDIVVPVFKEEETFAEFYKTAIRSIKSEWRLFVVYDLPDDPTYKLARSIAESDPRIIPLFNPDRGVAGAIKTGLRAASEEAIMVTAVDLLEDIKKIDEMVQLLYEEGYVIVAPSRYMRKGKRYAGKFLNRTLSRLASLSLHYLTGLPIHDATNGSKLYRKSFIDSLTIESTAGWVIALEITVKAHALGKPMIEIPIVQYERRAGKSKFKLVRWLPHYLKWYWFAVKNHFGGSNTNIDFKHHEHKNT